MTCRTQESYTSLGHHACDCMMRQVIVSGALNANATGQVCNVAATDCVPTTWFRNAYVSFTVTTTVNITRYSVVNVPPCYHYTLCIPAPVLAEPCRPRNKKPALGGSWAFPERRPNDEPHANHLAKPFIPTVPVVYTAHSKCQIMQYPRRLNYAPRNLFTISRCGKSMTSRTNLSRTRLRYKYSLVESTR